MEDDGNLFDFDEFAREQEIWSKNFIEEKKRSKQQPEQPIDVILEPPQSEEGPISTSKGLSAIALVVIAFILCAMKR